MDRDIVIERLERKLEERDSEIQDMKSSMRDYVKKEIETRTSESEERISKLESRVAEISGIVDGLVRELLDQKTRFKELTEKIETPKSVLTIEDIDQEGPEKEEKKEEPKKETEYIVAQDKKPDSKKVLKSEGAAFEERENEGVEMFFAPKRGD